MRIYKVKIPSSYVSGTRKWQLPCVKCTACGREWGGSGDDYPSVNLPKTLNPKDYRGDRRWVVSGDEFSQIITSLREWVPSTPKPHPGAGFGLYVGDVTGKLQSFATCLNEVFLTGTALESLRSFGLTNLVAVPTEIIVRKKQPEKLFELEVPVRAHLSKECIKGKPAKRCVSCGFFDVDLADHCYRWPDSGFVDFTKIKIRKRSIPSDAPLFKVEEVSGVYATDEFVRAVTSLGLTNITFKEVEVAAL